MGLLLREKVLSAAVSSALKLSSKIKEIDGESNNFYAFF